MSAETIEQMIIGRLMHVNADIEVASQKLKPHHFKYDIYKQLYEKILELNEKQISVNPISLENFTKTREQFKIDPNKAIVYLKKLVVMSHGLFDINSGIAILIKNHNLEKIKNSYEETYNLLVEEDEESKFIQNLSKLEDTIYSIKTNKEEHTYQTSEMLKIAKEYIENQKKKLPNEVEGLDTGYHNLNRKIDGLKKGELIILASRPSMGKTALATNIMLASCYRLKIEKPEKEKKILFFSLEMSALQIAIRSSSSLSNVSANDIFKNTANDEEEKLFLDGLRQFCGLPMIINENPQLEIDEIKSIIKTEIKNNNIVGVFIDYLQLIKDSKYKDKLSEITSISRKLKIIAKEFNIPVFVLSQLSRMTEQRVDKKPMLSDLRDSGTIEQDADIVLLLYREQYYLERIRPHKNDKSYSEWEDKFRRAYGKASLIVGKNRNGGVGELLFKFDGKKTKFTEELSQ